MSAHHSTIAETRNAIVRALSQLVGTDNVDYLGDGDDQDTEHIGVAFPDGSFVYVRVGENPIPAEDDLDACIRWSAEQDPAFATSFLNRQGESLLRLWLEAWESGGKYPVEGTRIALGSASQGMTSGGNGGQTT